VSPGLAREHGSGLVALLRAADGRAGG